MYMVRKLYGGKYGIKCFRNLPFIIVLLINGLLFTHDILMDIFASQ
jgi:hypothetical protein